MPVDFDVVCCAPRGDDVWKSILVQVRDHQIFGRHSAFVDARLSTTAPSFILRFVYGDTRAEPGFAGFSPPGNQFIVAVAVKICATQSVSLLHLRIQNSSRPQRTRFRRFHINDDLVSVPWFHGGQVALATLESSYSDLAGPRGCLWVIVSFTKESTLPSPIGTAIQ